MNLRSKYGRYECKCMECAECKLIENNTNTKMYYGFCNIKNQKMSVVNHRKCKFFRKIETRTDSTAPIISSCCGCIHLSKVWHGLEPEVAFCSLRKHDVNVYEQKICSTYHRIDMQYRYSCWNSDVAEFVENLNTCGYAITTKNMVGRLALLHVFPKMSVKEAKEKTEDEIIEELGRPPFLIEHKKHLRILKRVLDVGSEAKPIVPTSSSQAESHGYIIKTYAELGVPSTLISELTGIHVNHIREYINRNGIERGKNMRKRG